MATTYYELVSVRRVLGRETEFAGDGGIPSETGAKGLIQWMA